VIPFSVSRRALIEVFSGKLINQLVTLTNMKKFEIWKNNFYHDFFFNQSTALLSLVPASIFLPAKGFFKLKLHFDD
jgi:hypothetical protein